MSRIAKKTKRYPSDVTDEEWALIAPLMPKPGRKGRPREVEFCEVINAVRYLVRSGCGWRMLPVHFGAWQTVYGWFRELARRFLFQTIHDLALMTDREPAGREASPSAAVIDSQSIKAPQGKTRGYDAGKKIVGRKRHIAVDTDGRLLMVNITAADISDSAGAQTILDRIRKRWPWVKHLFADGAYDRLKLMDKAAYLDFVIEIIRRSDGHKGFQVLPRRWVVERSFGWMIRWRGLVRDYEARIPLVDAAGKPIVIGSKGRRQGNAESFVVAYDGQACVKHLEADNIVTVDPGDHECTAHFPYQPAAAGQRVAIGAVPCL